LAAPHNSVHVHAHVQAVQQANIAHAGHAHVLYVGDADGLHLHLADVDVPVAADFGALVAAHRLAAVAANADIFVVAHLLASVLPNADLLVLADLDALVDADVFRAVVANGDLLVVVDPLGAVVVDGDLLIVVYRFGAVAFDQAGLVAVDGFDAVVANPLFFVVLYFGQLVLLGVQPQLFGCLGVVKAQHVGVVVAPAYAFGVKAALVLLGGQLPRGHLGLVVGAAHNDGLVDVAVQEVDDDFLAYAGQLDAAVIGAGPGAGDAYPARALVVHGAGAVPMELDFDAAKLVAVDFLAGGADDGGGLDAGGGYRAAVGMATGAKGDASAHGGKTVAVDRIGAFLQVVVAAAVADAQEQELVVDGVGFLVVLKVLGQLKVAPGQQGAVVAAALEAFSLGFKLFQAQGGQVVASAGVGKG
jgi:hypothetical protein